MLSNTLGALLKCSFWGGNRWCGLARHRQPTCSIARSCPPRTTRPHWGAPGRTRASQVDFALPEGPLESTTAPLGACRSGNRRAGAPA